MSLLFDALKRAQQSVRGAEGKNAPIAAAAPSTSVEPTTNPHPDGGIKAARSMLSASARPERRFSPLILGGVIFLLIAAGGGWYYLEAALAPPPPLAIAAAPVPPPASEEVSPPATQPLPPVIETLAPVKPKPKPRKVQRKRPSTEQIAQKPVSPAAAAKTQLPPPASPSLSVLKTPGNNLLKEAYAALSEGKLDEAETKYLDVLVRQPHEKDALLGLAIIAQRKKQFERALDYYQQVLGEDPHNITAATGLYALSEQADPVATESRLRQLLEQKVSSAEPHYALGNVLARQKRWNEAQQSYFRAFSFKPDNALYAFNLAVSLDHLSKPSAALRYYEIALQLAGPDDRTLNRTAIQQRLLELNADQTGGVSTP